MNSMKTFYLAHPFNSRKAIRAWELKIEALNIINLFNPFYDSNGRGDVADVDAGRAPKYTCDPRDVVEGDLRSLRDSDGVVAVIDDGLRYGTSMEIVYAKEAHKLIYLIVTNGEEKHPWLVYHAARIFTSFEEFERFLREEFSHETQV